MAAETPYSVRFRGPTLIAKGKDTTVNVSVEHDGAAPTIVSAKFSLFDPSGSSLVDSAVASEAGGVVSYTITAATTTTKSLGKGYLVRFEVTIGTFEHLFSNNAALCIQQLYPPIGTTDLTNRFTQLAQLQTTGASDLQKYITDSWSDLLIKMYSGGLAFWTIRSPGHLREWVITRALSNALADLALVLGNGGPYRDESRRMEQSLKAKYEHIRSLLDVQETNQGSSVQQPASGVIQLSTGRGRYRGVAGSSCLPIRHLQRL